MSFHSTDLAIDAPSATALAYRLRHPETWQHGFEWNYANCRACAMELAALFWPHAIKAPRLQIDLPDFAKAIGLSKEAAERIFCDAAFVKGVPFSQVTPGLIADMLDEAARLLQPAKETS